MNHQYNEFEDLRKQSRSNQDRHFEMFLDRSRFTGWMFVASIFIAVTVLFKVLMPFQDSSEKFVGQTSELRTLEQEHLALTARRQSLQLVSGRFEQVRNRIAQPSWADAPEQLASRMRRLNRAYRVLLDASKEDLSRYIEQAKKQADAVGFLGSEVATLPASYQDDGAQPDPNEWMSPPSTTEAEAVVDAEEEPEVQPLTAQQLTALQNYFEASERVRQLGLVPDTGTTSAATAPEGEEVEEQEQSGEPEWMNTPPPSIRDSIRTLHVSPEEVLEFATFRERDSFLYEQLQARAREDANKVLQGVAQAVQVEIMHPLSTTATALEELQLNQISEPFAGLGEALKKWQTTHETETGWYQTVAANGQSKGDVFRALGAILANTDAVLEKQSMAVLQERTRTARRIEQVGTMRTKLKESRAVLESRLDSVMPAWLSGIITAAELIQVFPMLLILLVIALGYNVSMVRDHFLLARVPGVDRVPYRAATLWTLVQRGGFRTLSSMVVLLGGLTLLWFSYEQAVILMTRWAALDGSTPWMFTGHISEAAPWIGRTVFLAAASAVVLALLWREQSTPEPEAA